MAEAVVPKTQSGSKIGGFLQQTTAGLPNWAWFLVIGAGVTAAILIPKLFPGITGAASTPTTPTAPVASGLAIDPNTGLPYIPQGTQPAGGIIPGSTNNPNSVMVRSATPLYSGDTYESTHPQGAQTFSSPEIGTPSGYAPWGSQLTLAGLTPTTNTQNQSFYQLSNGSYILAQDLTGLQGVQGSGSTGPSAGWPYAGSYSRNYRNGGIRIHG